MADPTPVLDDLRAESDELDRLVAELTSEQWALPTPAPGWTVAHQIAHLAWTDRASVLAVTDQDAFSREVEKALTAPGDFVDNGAEEGARKPPSELLAEWRDGREALQKALRAAHEGARFPWYGPPMAAASMATARLMETWAHGLDVADALGVAPEPSDRLRHIVRLGVRTRDFAFGVHGMSVPFEEFRVELRSPGGDLWVFGPEDAEDRVTGPALDFCRLVTQRAHRADLALHAEGPDADRWLDIAQAFAGPPGSGRAPKTADTGVLDAVGRAGEAEGAGDAGKPDDAGKASDAVQAGDAEKASDAEEASDAGKPDDAGKASDAGQAGHAEKASETGKPDDAGKASDAAQAGDAEKASEAEEASDAGKPDDAGKASDAQKAGDAGKGSAR